MAELRCKIHEIRTKRSAVRGLRSVGNWETVATGLSYSSRVLEP
jgi:hypothetical protein